MDIMVDLETLGVGRNAVFLSIGAIQFEPHSGQTFDVFKMNIDLRSAMDAGLKIEANTLHWWLMQKPEIMQGMFEGDCIDIKAALNSFTAFCGKANFMWGNSAAFDLGLLRDGYNAVSLPVPFTYRQERCYRTMYSTFQFIIPELTLPKDAHNPIVDCRFQIENLANIYKLINTYFK